MLTNPSQKHNLTLYITRNFGTINTKKLHSLHKCLTGYLHIARKHKISTTIQTKNTI